MRFRHALTVLVLATAGTLPLAGAAYAQPDRDCADFATQAEAQEALDGAPGDPERLDANGDGVACESAFREAADTTTEPAPTSAAADADEGAAQDDQDEQEDQPDQPDQGQVRVLPRGGVDTGDGSTELGLLANPTSMGVPAAQNAS